MCCEMAVGYSTYVNNDILLLLCGVTNSNDMGFVEKSNPES